MTHLEKKEFYTDFAGIEVSSIQFEGVVSIENGYLLQDGKKIHPTETQITELLNEMFYEEFGTCNFNMDEV